MYFKGYIQNTPYFKDFIQRPPPVPSIFDVDANLVFAARTSDLEQIWPEDGGDRGDIQNGDEVRLVEDYRNEVVGNNDFWSTLMTDGVAANSRRGLRYQIGVSQLSGFRPTYEAATKSIRAVAAYTGGLRTGTSYMFDANTWLNWFLHEPFSFAMRISRDDIQFNQTWNWIGVFPAAANQFNESRPQMFLIHWEDTGNTDFAIRTRLNYNVRIETNFFPTTNVPYTYMVVGDPDEDTITFYISAEEGGIQVLGTHAYTDISQGKHPLTNQNFSNTGMLVGGTWNSSGGGQMSHRNYGAIFSNSAWDEQARMAAIRYLHGN